MGPDHIAPDGATVRAGQPVALVGHSGNASPDAPHLHIERHPGGGAAVDAYPMLAAACSGPAVERAALRPQPGQPGGGGCYATFTSWRWLACVHQGHGHPVGSPGHSVGQLRAEWRQLIRYLRASGNAVTGSGSLVWHWQLVANCESGDNIWAVSASGTYRGWLQFSQSSWTANGGQGDPLGQPREVAARIAENYRLQAGTSPWPVCGAYYR